MYKYNNLIKELEITRPEQVWVSDITSIRRLNGFIYLSLVTDTYSRKIVSYNLHKTLAAEGCIIALQNGNGKPYLQPPVSYTSFRQRMPVSNREGAPA